MDRFSKQFAALGTGSGSNVFLKARLKLTGLYVLIIAVIIFGFSIFLYNSVSHNLRDASDDEFADSGSHQHFVENTLGSVEYEILFADLFILVVSAGVSYVLAGKTLLPIQQSVEVQKAFATNASHELRTPLAVMRNDIEVFLRNTAASKEGAQVTMHSNLEEIGRMSGIVENLLLLARSDNQLAPQLTKIDISELAKTMVEKMQPLAESRGVKIIYAPSNPISIQGSSSSLQRVLLNIFQNSIDHTDAGGSIITKITKDDSYAVLRISDTGSGISPRDLPHVFTRFYKGDSDKGTGLGLSIVKEIVAQHGGDIQVTSKEGEGTTVTIKIPTA